MTIATYKYQQNMSGPAAGGYVKYNISPDFGTPVTSGETITITGEAYLPYRVSKSISADFYTGLGFSERWQADLNITIPKATPKTFTITFTLPEWNDRETYTFNYRRTLDGLLMFTLYDGTIATRTFGDGTDFVEGQQVTILGYRNALNLTSFALNRYKQQEDSSGTVSYVRADDGQYVLIESLSATIDPHLQAEHITVRELSWKDDNGAVGTVTIPAASIVPGCAEISPGIFPAPSFMVGNTYTFTLKVGDAYDVQTSRLVVPRSFANLHLSGAKNGGAAFGKFSSATDEEPLLESAYPFVPLAGIHAVDNALEVIELPITGALFEPSGIGAVLMRYGNICELFVRVKPNTTIAGSTTMYEICKIPANYRPLAQLVQRENIGALTMWRMVVSASGDVSFTTAQNNNGYVSVSTSTTLTGHAMWLIPNASLLYNLLPEEIDTIFDEDEPPEGG